MNRTLLTSILITLLHTICVAQNSFKDLTRFEKKINEMELQNEFKDCNAYIDKHLRKGKLTSSERNFAYYIKCRIYSQYNYDFWGTNFDVLNKRASRIPDIYPYSEVYPINQADTLIRYSRLFLNAADTSSLVYKYWFGFVYNDIYSVVEAGLDTLVEHAFYTDNYYADHKADCDQYFTRLTFLKQAVHDFHPVNQMGINLMEHRLKHSLGLMTENDEQRLVREVSDYMHDRFDLRELEGVVFWGDPYRGFTELSGFGDVGLQVLLKELYTHKRQLARKILTHCPDDVTKMFASYNTLDTTWRIVKSDVLTNKRLIDLRDSALYDSYTFPIYTSFELEYNVPEGDTVVISKVHCDDPEGHDVHLSKRVSMTGSGTSMITVITYQRVPEIDEVTRLWLRDIQLISNRGVHKFGFKANVVGQNRVHITDSMKERYQKTFVQEDYPYYYEEVLQVNCDNNYGTDTLKIYQYPQNDIPIYRVVPNVQYEEPKQVHPLEVTTDSLYHFNLLEETRDAYKVVYSNYHWDFEIGWIKKADIDTSRVKLQDIIKTIDLTQFFTNCEYVTLRNPAQDIFAPTTFVASFADDKIVPDCKRFKYVKHWNKPGEVPTMLVQPCENCTDPKLLEWGSAQLQWADGMYMLVEGENH